MATQSVSVYFENLAEDEKYAWLAIVVGLILVLVAVILW